MKDEIENKNKIRVLRKIRVLSVNQDTIYASKGYSVIYSHDNGETWILLGVIKDLIYSFFSMFRLLARLFRAEVNFFIQIEEDSSLCIAKKGIFKLNRQKKKYHKVFHVKRGSRPINICIDSNGYLYFGEYFSNKNRDQVNIYKSLDQGECWDVVYTFPAGEIKHIHGIFYDKFENLLWVVTGDLENECIIANTSDEFRTLNIVFRGGQEYRTTSLLFFKDYIIYGTDSQFIKNSIYLFDRKTLKREEIQKVQGPILSSCIIGNSAFMSTGVEPSSINKDRYAYIWALLNISEWKELISFEKDILPARLFQFGSIYFPSYSSDVNRLFFSGHALKGIDGNSVVYELNI